MSLKCLEKMITRSIFIYYLDYEIQKLFDLKRTYGYKRTYNCLSLITRIAYLVSSEELLLPASNYFESDIAFNIVNSLKALSDFGYIKLLSSSYNLSDLLDVKKEQHEENIDKPGYHYIDYISPKKQLILPGKMVKRYSSASEDIKNAWLNSIDNNFWENVYKDSHTKHISTFQNELNQVPERLGKKAFISEYIMPLLPINDYFRKKYDSLINTFITQEYILSYLREYKAVCIKDIPLFDTTFLLPNDKNWVNKHISFKEVFEYLQNLNYKKENLIRFISSCNDIQLIELKNSSFWMGAIETFIESKDNKKSSLKNKFIYHNEKGVFKVQKPKIFIIHGHDEEMKKSLQLLLTRADLDDVVLHEVSNRGRTLIDKLIEEGEKAAFVISVFSHDDITTSGEIRTRQNVILETGYFLGKLGKSKVMLLIKEGVSIPSDLQGIVYEVFKGGWEMKVLKEIKDSGIVVNMDNTIQKI